MPVTLMRRIRNAEHTNDATFEREAFDEFHYPKCPTLRTLQGVNPKEVGPPKIKKVKLSSSLTRSDAPVNAEATQLLEDMEVQFALMTTLAAHPDLRDKIGLGRYQSTQHYRFTFSAGGSFTKQLRAFPWDVHPFSLDAEFEPGLIVQKFSKQAPTSERRGSLGADAQPEYQLILPGGLREGLVGSQKIKPDTKLMSGMSSEGEKLNFYLRCHCKPWHVDASSMIYERIPEFDIQPFSLTLRDNAAHAARLAQYKGDHEQTARKSFSINFVLVRHVMGPALSVLLPLWVIMFMQPYAYYFDFNEGPNDVFGYVVTLLLTTIAHRQVMQESIQSLRLTSADFTFLLAVVLIFCQMGALLALSRRLEDGEPDGLHIYAFGGHMFFNVLVVGYNLVKIAAPLTKLADPTSVPEFLVEGEGDKTPPFFFCINMRTYQAWTRLQLPVLRAVVAALKRDDDDDETHSFVDAAADVFLEDEELEPVGVAVDSRRRKLLLRFHRLGENLPKRFRAHLGFDRKTFFAYNVKALAKGQRPCDLFRFRLPTEFTPVLDAKLGALKYVKAISFDRDAIKRMQATKSATAAKSNFIRVAPLPGAAASDSGAIAGGEDAETYLKKVYHLHLGSTDVPCEVQYVPIKDSECIFGLTKRGHDEYKRAKLRPLRDASSEINTPPYVIKFRLLVWLFQSLVFEIARRKWSHVATDVRLLRLTWAFCSRHPAKIESYRS